MYEDLIASDELSIARKSVLPGTGFFLPDSIEDDLESARARAALEGAEAAVVADSDADGLACVALVREVYDDVQTVPRPDSKEGDEADIDPSDPIDGLVPTDEVDPIDGADSTDEVDPIDGADSTDEVDPIDGADSTDEVDPIDGETDSPEPTGPTHHRVALLPASPHDLEDSIQQVADYADEGIDLYVCDLSPDRFEYVEAELAAAVEVAERVSWYDHHQWKDDVATAVRELGVDLVIGDSETECSADVVHRSLEYDFDDRHTELAAVTRDHDLWLREDPRSDDLADFAYWSAPSVYVEVVREYGVTLPSWAEAFLEERRVEKNALIDHAVARADMYEIGEYTVGVTYGRCSQNEVAEAMREQGADASVIVKPAGSVSIRGTDRFERCHEVAALVNGGGHPKAAGCKPDIYDDMLDYAHHWTTRGAVTKRVLLAAFERVIDES